MNNKILLSKRTSAIFLAIVLVTGTIAAISPSSFIIGEAQAQPYYGMDSYGPTDYRDDKKKYASYGYSYYGMDSSYDDRKSYDKKPYGNDNSYYESQYQSSYKPDYKPKYSSYDGKDDKRDKSKDSSKSVSINKIKCINTNLNINGNNTGDISIGNKGAAEGYLAGYSSTGGSGYDGHSKKDKDFECIINNNNNNINIVSGDGNVTESNATLAVTKTVTCTSNSAFPLTVQACQTILNTILPSSFNIVVTGNNPNPSEFAGSTVPVVVTLGAGDYRVTESAVAPPVIPGISIIQEENFAGNCIEDGFNSLSAIGKIAAGEFQTCDISNDFTARLFD